MAWRAADSYDADRGSVRTWLYRIATNACLTALHKARSRPLPSVSGSASRSRRFVGAQPRGPWLIPLPADPAASAVERSRLRLALVAALQLLPPRQRAALLREVLEVPAAEVAAILGLTPAAVNSSLQRARARLAAWQLDPEAPAIPTAEQRAVVDRYVAAFERADVAGITVLLSADVVLEMPPRWNWYVGPAAYAGFIERVYRTRGTGWRSMPLWANGEAGSPPIWRARRIRSSCSRSTADWWSGPASSPTRPSSGSSLCRPR